MEIIIFEQLEQICATQQIIFEQTLSSSNEIEQQQYFKEFITEPHRFEDEYSLDGSGFGEYSGDKQFFISTNSYIGICDKRDCGIDIIKVYDIQFKRGELIC